MLTKKEPEKKLLLSIKKKAGRSKQGRITVRHRGGGPKKLYRIIDFGQKKINIPAKVIALEYDPFRTGFIALLEYQDKEKSYQIAPQGLKLGDEVITAEKAQIRPGNRMRIGNIPVGTTVYNIEIQPNRGGKLIRSAGTGGIILAHENNYTHLKMPSSEIRRILQKSFASIGVVSYPEHKFVFLNKAGNVRHRGRRPQVRGLAMNPVDHPHGGGEGRAGIGMKHPKTPWGKPALGVKTRKRKQTNKYIIQRRKKK